jgi:ATP-binding cassette subfamily F protein 3
MLAARDLTLRRGPEPLFERANFTLFRGNKVGLTGANGAGKSSLFAAIRGDLGPDEGDIERPAQLRMAHVEQEVAASDRPAIEFVLDGDTELRRILAAIDAAERREAALELAEWHAALEAIDGYRARANAAALMHGLGFKPRDLERPVTEFSGGWRVRLAMARALGSRADLLLLDEPTNHLDLDAIVWLEQWLQAFPGTLLMISHDREFLDAIIDRVLHIENRTIRAYSGNYSQFEQKRAEELALQQNLQSRQARRIAEISSFVNRFRAKASKSRQAQSRLKMLQKMERIVPAHVDSPFEFEFGVPLKTPRPLLTVENAACGYAGHRIVSGINVSLGPHDRIALLGPNGAGKSTVTKMLAGALPGEPMTWAGRRTAAADLSIGYFAQQQMEQLQPECDAFWHMREQGGADYAGGDEQRVRDHLGRFGFQGDRAFDPVARFSGGEKARSTNPPIISTSTCGMRSPSRCKASRAASWSYPTTATSSRRSPTRCGWWLTVSSRCSTAIWTITSSGSRNGPSGSRRLCSDRRRPNRHAIRRTNSSANWNGSSGSSWPSPASRLCSTQRRRSPAPVVGTTSSAPGWHAMPPRSKSAGWRWAPRSSRPPRT